VRHGAAELGIIADDVLDIASVGPGRLSNIVAELDTVKVVEYERAGTRITQTTELRSNLSALLRTLGVSPPPKVHEVRPVSIPPDA
jgi:hypothetical protein